MVESNKRHVANLRTKLCYGLNWTEYSSADYIEQPWLADIEYYKVDVNAGDCVYIPYMW